MQNMSSMTIQNYSTQYLFAKSLSLGYRNQDLMRQKDAPDIECFTISNVYLISFFFNGQIDDRVFAR